MSSNNNNNNNNNNRHKQYDIIIVGGGIIGCSTAFRLLHTGFTGSILLLEKTSKIANCASGNAGGFLARNWCQGEGALHHLAQFSFDLHGKYAAEVGADVIGFRKMSAVSVTVGGKGGGRQEVKCDSASSSSAKWMKGEGVMSVENLVENDETTAQVHPRQLSESLLLQASKIAKSRNQIFDVVTSCGVAELLFSSPATQNQDEQQHQQRCIGVKDDKENVIKAAIAVCLCVGPWTAHIDRWIPQQQQNDANNVSIYSTPYLTELAKSFHLLKVQSISICPSSSSSSSSVSSRTTPPQAIFTYPDDTIDKQFSNIEPEIYPRPDGTIYLCGISDKEELPSDPSQVCGNPQKAKVLREFADLVLGARRDNGIDQGTSTTSKNNDENNIHSHEDAAAGGNNNNNNVDFASAACYLPMPSDNRRPLIGSIPETNDSLFFASGHNCWGILNSHGTGVALTEMIFQKNPGKFLNPVEVVISDKIRTLLPSNLLKFVTTELEEKRGRNTTTSAQPGTKRKNANW